MLKEIEKEIESEDEKRALTILGDEIVTEIQSCKREFVRKIAFTDKIQAYITKQPYILKPYILSESV